MKDSNEEFESINVVELAKIAACKVMDIPLSEFGKKCKENEFVTARNLVRVYLRLNTSFSLKKIGRLTSARDHSVVKKSLKLHNNLMETNNGHRSMVNLFVHEFTGMNKITSCEMGLVTF